MKQWFYCPKCKRWTLREVEEVNTCDRCGDIVQGYNYVMKPEEMKR